MKIIKEIKSFLTEKFFNVKWRCNGCKRENFDGGYFCKECEEKLPYVNEAFCNHCGRSLKASSNYCSTCKEHIVNLSKCRSVFDYKQPISKLIQDLKYENDKYLFELFTHYLEIGFKKYNLTADYITFVPMTEKSKKKRGYNQSERLVEELSKAVNIPVFYGVEKVVETAHQAKLDRKNRMKNLEKAYRVKDKKTIKDKVVLIIDDVSTTGSTLEALSEKIKDTGAKEVIALTIASVPPKEGY